MIWLEKLPDDWWKAYQSHALSFECIHELNNELLFLVRSLLLETRTYARVCKHIRLSIYDFQNALIARSLNSTSKVQYIEESLISLSSVIEQDETCSSNVDCIQLTMHWLAIDGQQPIIPENSLPNFSEENPSNEPSRKLNDSSPLLQKLFHRINSSSLPRHNSTRNHIHPSTKNSLILKPIHPRNIPIHRSHPNDNLPHELSIEQQLYFKSLTESCFYGTDQQQIHAWHCLASDAALQPLLPRLLLFFCQGIQTNIHLQDLNLIQQFLSLLKRLLTNKFISFDKHLHLIIPGLLTCLLCIFDQSKSNQFLSTLDSIQTNNYYSTVWTMRETASDLIIDLERKFSTIPYLTERICSIIQSNLMNESSTLTYSIVYASTRTLFAINIDKYSRPLSQTKLFAIDFDLDPGEQQTLFDQKIKQLYENSEF